MPHPLQMGSRVNARVMQAYERLPPEDAQEDLLMARTPAEYATTSYLKDRSDILTQRGFKCVNGVVDGLLGKGFIDRVRHPARDLRLPRSFTEAVATTLHFTLTAATAPVVIPAYRTGYGCSGRAPFRRGVRDRGWRFGGRALAIVPGALSESAALLGAGIKAAPLGVVHLAIRSGVCKTRGQGFVPLKNKHTLAMQEPLDDLPKEQVFVTADRWQFDVDELFACLVARGDFVNPLSLEPLTALDLARLAKHPRCPQQLQQFLNDDIALGSETVRRLLALAKILAEDRDAPVGNPRSVLAMGTFSDYYNTLSSPVKETVRNFGIEALLERTRQGENCIHNTGAVVPGMVRQLLQAGRAEPDAMRFLDYMMDDGPGAAGRLAIALGDGPDDASAAGSSHDGAVAPAAFGDGQDGGYAAGSPHDVVAAPAAFGEGLDHVGSSYDAAVAYVMQPNLDPDPVGVSEHLNEAAAASETLAGTAADLSKPAPNAHQGLTFDLEAPVWPPRVNSHSEALRRRRESAFEAAEMRRQSQAEPA